MSTKTTFKRIALVAVAALGLGVLSVAPSSAAGTGYITPTVGLVKGSAAAATTATGIVGGQVAFTYNVAANTTQYISSDANGTIVSGSAASGNGTVTNTNGTGPSGGLTWVPDYDSSTITVTMTASAAGTNVVSVKTINGTTGAATTQAYITITWVTAPAAASLSTAFINSGATYAASNTTTPSSPKGTTAVANVGVSLKDASGNALVGQKLTVSLTGPGTIAVRTTDSLVAGTTAFTQTSAGVRAATDASAHTGSTWYITLFGDGSAGTSTMTISVGTTVIGVKTWTFTDAVKTLTATQNYSIAKASSTGAELGSSVSNTTADSTNVAAFTVFAADSAGNAVTGKAGNLSCKIADLTVISSCTIEEDNAAYGAGDGYYNVSVTSAAGGTSGKSTTLYVRILNADGVTYTQTADLTYTLGGAIASTTVALDQASYEPGAPMQLTITAKDASGNATYDGQSIAAGLSASKPVGGSLPATTKKFAKGKYSTSLTSPTLFAPSVSGAFSISVTGNDAASTVTTTSATVTNAAQDAATDAANEATDAANAATDAALAAADAADAATAAAQDASDAVAALSATVAKLVASLKAQITSLTNLVIKIQKKVKA